MASNGVSSFNGTGSVVPDDIATYSSTATHFVEGSEQTASGTNWEAILILLIGALGVILLFAVIVQACCQRRRRQEIEVPGDAEDGVANNTASQQPKKLSFPLYQIALVLALCMSITVHASCEFLKLYEDPSFLALGLWRTRYQHERIRDDEYDYRIQYVRGGECRSNFRTVEYEQDDPLLVARIAATMATIVGGICCVLGLLFLCCFGAKAGKKTRAKELWLITPLLVATVAQLVPLCLLNSIQCESNGDDCYPDFGAIMAILASYFWCLAAFALALPALLAS
ncbi:expressed unknown protein [Seminavis robusta]|uniref:Uncharacterized protein n=1 Tax=Seminavis robusta TaxID=568900 RepID=A0A9N8D9R8_9STRA|nr:expressed unknown protein [Seminavis robusta]|eukprot:Sro55_g032430.1 n/a (284) ;mRNA; f:112376-113227